MRKAKNLQHEFLKDILVMNAILIFSALAVMAGGSVLLSYLFARM